MGTVDLLTKPDKMENTVKAPLLQRTAQGKAAKRKKITERFVCVY